jgi:peptide/nickel transport system permease protein
MTRRALGFALLALPACFALAAPWLAAALGHDPFAPDLFNRFAPPSAAHPLGTDELGRDILLRLAYGARVSLAVGLATALAAAALGTLIGLIAAWRGGAADAALMRLADALLALPALPLLVLLAGLDPAVIGLPRGEAGSDILRIVVILVLFGWVGVARLARAAALSTLALDYVRAARALGASPPASVINPSRRASAASCPSRASPPATSGASASASASGVQASCRISGMSRPPRMRFGSTMDGAVMRNRASDSSPDTL